MKATTEKITFNVDFSWPTTQPYVITAKYGLRWGKLHEGIDISGTGYNSPIYSVSDGIVYKVGHNAMNGNYIILAHENDLYTLYSNLSKTTVKIEQKIKKAETIGLMGNTGCSTGTHLHFGVFKGIPFDGGISINPLTLIEEKK